MKRLIAMIEAFSVSGVIVSLLMIGDENWKYFIVIVLLIHSWNYWSKADNPQEE